MCVLAKALAVVMAGTLRVLVPLPTPQRRGSLHLSGRALRFATRASGPTRPWETQTPSRFGPGPRRGGCGEGSRRVAVRGVRYEDQPEPIYIVLTAEDVFRPRVKVTSESNPALYNLLDQRGAGTTEPQPSPEPTLANARLTSAPL